VVDGYADLVPGRQLHARTAHGRPCGRQCLSLSAPDRESPPPSDRLVGTAAPGAEAGLALFPRSCP
jgi:hypothetical protein